VTFTWLWVEDSEGGREESAARWPAPFEAEAWEAGEGWMSGVRRRVGKQVRERGAGVQRCGPTRHGCGGSGLL
jgi:hypothetical protein